MIEIMARGAIKRSTSMPTTHSTLQVDAGNRRRNGMAHIFSGLTVQDIEVINNFFKFIRTSSFSDDLDCTERNLNDASQAKERPCADGVDTTDCAKCQFFIDDTCEALNQEANEEENVTAEFNHSGEGLVEEDKHFVGVCRNRRMALADIFSGVPEDQTADFLARYSEEGLERTDEQPRVQRRHRRNALADIFDELNDEERQRLSDLVHDKSDSDNECTSEISLDFETGVNCCRRMAKGYVFEGISVQDKLKLLKVDDSLSMSAEECDVIMNNWRKRRDAMGAIFDSVTEVEVRRLWTSSMSCED